MKTPRPTKFTPDGMSEESLRGHLRTITKMLRNGGLNKQEKLKLLDYSMKLQQDLKLTIASKLEFRLSEQKKNG
jgi:hypothetical protein